jgi:HAMP domain-containing protein
MKAIQKAAARNGSSTRDNNVLLKTLVAFKRGNFDIRMPVDGIGVTGKIADTLNDILELNQKMVGEFARISKAVGKDGKITQRVSIGSVTGDWAECVESVNSLIGDLVQPSTEVARVIGAVAKGDLAQTMSLEVDGRPLRGEFLHTARVVNTMVQQLNSFASEVTRVAREVGTEGKLGGQAVLTGVAGTWKDLTESVNSMASNLTDQVRRFDHQDHGGCARRNSGIEEHHQYHGGSAQLVRGRSYPRGARSGYRGKTWWPG